MIDPLSLQCMHNELSGIEMEKEAWAPLIAAGARLLASIVARRAAIGAATRGAASAVGGVARGAASAVGNAAKSVVPAAQKAVSAIGSGAQSAGNTVAQGAKSVASTVNNAMQSDTGQAVTNAGNVAGTAGSAVSGVQAIGNAVHPAAQQAVQGVQQGAQQGMQVTASVHLVKEAVSAADVMRAANAVRSSAAWKGTGNYLRRSAGNAGAGMGIGAGLGTLIGGVHGAVRGYQGNPEEEGSGGVLGALSGGVGGGARGAAIGSVAGGLAGLASGGRGSEQLQRVMNAGGKYRDWNPIGIAGKGGQRQVHSVTGLVPGGAQRGTEEYLQGLTDINAGGLGTQEKALSNMLTTQKPSAIGKLLGYKDKNFTHKQIQAAAGALQKSQAAAQAGQTSLAGMVHNIGQKGLREGGGELLQNITTPFKGQSWKGKLLAGGMMAVPVGMAAMQTINPETAERRGEVIGEAAGSSAVGALTPMLGSTGANILGRGGAAVGGTVGKGIDKLVGAVRRPTPGALGTSPPGTGAQPDLSAPPVQREYTNAAMGKPPEGLMV